MAEEIDELRKRILLPWQVQRGSSVWAPWGKSGWSALEIRKPQQKWAHGMRVKPHNGVETAKGKVRKDRLIKRDPKLKGKDRPGFTPNEVFAPLEENEKVAKAEKAHRKQQKIDEANLAQELPPAPTLNEGKERVPPDLKEVWIQVIVDKGKTREEAEREYNEHPTTDDW